MTSPWLTLDEAAAYTKLSPATQARARKGGALRAYRVQGKKLSVYLNATDVGVGQAFKKLESKRRRAAMRRRGPLMARGV